MMSRAARLHDDRAGFLPLEEADQFAPAQLSPELYLSGFVYCVDLEDGLRGIQTDHRDAHCGRPPFCRSLTTLKLGILIHWEIPRLCRGGSRSLTFPGG